MLHLGKRSPAFRLAMRLNHSGRFPEEFILRQQLDFERDMGLLPAAPGTESPDREAAPRAPASKKPRPYKPRKHKDFSTSRIQQHLREGFYSGESGAKEFRDRYRLPMEAYAELKSELLEAEPNLDSASSGVPRNLASNLIPFDNKLLTVLRVLGRGMSTTDDVDHSDMSHTSIRRAVRDISKTVSEKLFDKWVYAPRNADELANSMQLYEDVGFPGCIGSTDVVHVAWDRCPAGLYHLHKGRYGYPTLAFECTVRNDLWFQAATRARAGTHNDKCIVRSDPFICALRDGFYADATFKLFRQDGTQTTENDPYVVVDGGYHRWRHMICGYPHTADPAQSEWTSQLGSVRKDAECAFGILKKRWRILKVPLQLAQPDEIDAIFRTCLVLHNMCLKYDSREYIGHSRNSAVRHPPEAEVTWGDHCELEGATFERTIPALGLRGTWTAQNTGLDGRFGNEGSHMGTEGSGLGDELVEINRDPHLGFEARRKKLVEHYHFVNKRRNQ